MKPIRETVFTRKGDSTAITAEVSGVIWIKIQDETFLSYILVSTFFFSFKKDAYISCFLGADIEE